MFHIVILNVLLLQKISKVQILDSYALTSSFPDERKYILYSKMSLQVNRSFEIWLKSLVPCVVRASVLLNVLGNRGQDTSISRGLS